MNIWILFVCAVTLGVKGLVTAQSDEADILGDYFNDDYDDEWYQSELEKLGIISTEQKDAPEDDNNFNNNKNIADIGIPEKTQDEMDKTVEREIQQFKIGDVDSSVNDYQFEDNRSELKELLGGDKKDIGEKDELSREVNNDINDDNNDSESAASAVDYDAYGIKLNDKGELDIEAIEKDMLSAQEGNDEEVFVSKDDNIVPLPMLPQSNDEVEQIFKETKEILIDEAKKSNDFANDEVEDKLDYDIEDIVEETKKILDETNSQFDEEVNKYSQINDAVVENPEEVIMKNDIIDKNISNHDDDEDEDTVDKVYQDLNDDLDTLFETISKLRDSENEDDAPINADYAVNSQESLDDKVDYENIFDSNLSDVFAEHSNAEDEMAGSMQVLEEALKTDSITTKEQDEAKENLNETKEGAYVNDALVSNDDNDSVSVVKPTSKSVSVDELSDDQLEQLVEDFAVQHIEAFDIAAADDQHVPYDHVVNEISLKYGEAKVIMSDNYPEAYPTNKIVDWIITGEGAGVEINVTDFAVNSAVEHYLLVKPGQLEDSGSDGLIFAYHLNSPRAYRFMDVDRLFLRFNSMNGFSFSKGFNLTVQMIAPLSEEPEPLPEPEPVLPEPINTLTVHLGGLTLQGFKEIEEDFRLLVADMATMYINANGIDPGMNTTAEITQITSAHICNAHWPGYEQCAAVTLSVPLQYEEEKEEHLNVEDLSSMWNRYMNQDPFASRLRQMGIEEFAIPNDGRVLIMWVMVALGALVSAAMLALALWRYTCFKDYSRMPTFGDTDSISKKHMDLYPTPHQTLPPLYAQNEYKWDKFEDSTRVNMGGFSNRSYVRTDMYDLDSDEDVVVPRDRFTTDV